MIIINRQGEFITGSVNGQQFGVSFDEEKYRTMVDLRDRADDASDMEELKAIVEEFLPLTKESFKEIVETASPYIHVNKSTNKFYLKYGDKVSSQPLPQVFVDKILKSVEKNIDVTPLIKCWARFMRPIPGRPAYTLERATAFAKYIDADYLNQDIVEKLTAEEGLSHEAAKARATTKQVAITQEGLLVCYKVSREIKTRFELDEETEDVKVKSRYGKTVDPDTGLVTYNTPDYVEDRLFEPFVMGKSGNEFFCGEKLGHFIKVGHVHYLDNWNKVSSPGSKGLHCGGLEYIKGFQSQTDSVTHNIFVDPMDIHSVATHHADGAMTVKRYFVHSSFAGPNKSIYHSSKYAAITDAEYAILVEEAVEATKMKAAELESLLDEGKALINVGRESKDGVKPVTSTDVFGT